MNHWMMATRWLWGVVAAVALLTWAGPAQAQEDEAPWRDTLTCNPARQTYQGVEYCTGLDGRAHVVVVDLHDTAGLRFEYVIAEGRDRNGVDGPCRDVNLPAWSSGLGCYDPATATYDPKTDTYDLRTAVYPIMSLAEAVARVPAAAVIVDTDYGAKSGGDRGHGPEGLTIVRGQRFDGKEIGDVDNNAVNRPWVALSAAAPFQVEFGQLTDDDGSKPRVWIDTGVGGSPWLIRDGQRVYYSLNDCVNTDPGSCSRNVAQAAVALSRNGRWLYFVIAKGVDAAGITDFLVAQLDPREAIKFDGGGSTQMWYGGMADEEARYVSKGDGRLLSQYLAIIAPPGDGIDVAPPVDPPPPPVGDDWWARLWSGIEQRLAGAWAGIEQQVSDWWAKVQADVERQFNEWWQSAQEELARAIETESNRLLDQLCGAAGLPAVVAGSLALARRRRTSR